MKKIIPLALLAILFFNGLSLAQEIVAHNTVGNSSANVNWIKSKIEKYGGNQRKEAFYNVEFAESTGKLIITEFNSGSTSPKFKYTMPICDFKEVRRNGMDIEILTKSTSIIGNGFSSNQESVWAGIRISHFVQAESNIVKRLHNAFKSLSEASSTNCK